MWGYWLIPVLLVIAIYLLVKDNSGFKTRSTETPLDILKKRFANGEIGAEEYQEKKKILEQ